MTGMKKSGKMVMNSKDSGNPQCGISGNGLLKKYIKWKFWIGVSYSKTALRYKNANMNFKRIIISRVIALIDFLLMLLGEICGFIRYFYLIFYRKKTTKKPANLSKLFNADE